MMGIPSMMGMGTKPNVGGGNGLLNNVVACYELNESSGNAIDAHAGLTMTAVNSPGTTTGVVGGARTFNGTTQYFTRTGINVTGGITLAAWVYALTSDTKYRTVITKRNDSLSNRANYAFDMQNGEFRFYINIAGSWNIWTTSSVSLSTSTWTHMAVTYDEASAPKFYKNGVLQTSSATLGTGTPAMPTNTAATNLGRYDGTVDPGDSLWHGYLDQPVIFDAAEDVSKILSLYNSGVGLAYSLWTT